MKREEIDAQVTGKDVPQRESERNLPVPVNRSTANDELVVHVRGGTYFGRIVALHGMDEEETRRRIVFGSDEDRCEHWIDKPIAVVGFWGYFAVPPASSPGEVRDPEPLTHLFTADGEIVRTWSGAVYGQFRSLIESGASIPFDPPILGKLIRGRSLGGRQYIRFDVAKKGGKRK
jgi:hypothetical protein